MADHPSPERIENVRSKVASIASYGPHPVQEVTDLQRDCTRDVMGRILIDAVRKQNGDLVRKLVQLGADVNTVSDCETPLLVACGGREMDIVKVLVESGANSNLHAGNGITPLMKAASDPSLLSADIVTYLAGQGADCNIQTPEGETALHRAVYRGNDIVLLRLLQCGAKILPDNHGFTPLYAAANMKSAAMSGLFYESSEVPFEDKVNAMEFFAARSAPQDMNAVYQRLRIAMTYRYTYVCTYNGMCLGVPLLKKPVCQPVAAFEYARESQCLWELQAREGNDHVLMMECLAVFDRLLGKGRMCLAANFNSIWKHLFYEGFYETSMSLIEYGMEFLPTTCAAYIFHDLIKPETMNHQGPGKSEMSVAEERLQLCQKLLKREPEPKPYEMSAYFSLLISSMELLNVCYQLDSTEEKVDARRIAKEYFAIFPLSSSGLSSPLHAVTHLLLTESTGVDFSLYKLLVSLLTKCGADINKKDSLGNTPLRMVLLDTALSSESRRQIVAFLLESNAHPAYLENGTSLPYRGRLDDEIIQMLEPYYPLPLQLLAVNTVLRSNVQYESHVPPIMQNCIKGFENAEP